MACAALIAVVGVAGRARAIEQSAGILQTIFANGVRINMMLLAFNLLPIPPLDGSHVVKHLLPPRWALGYQRLGFYGIAIILLVMYVQPSLLTRWLQPALAFGDAMLSVVRHTVLPTAASWLQ